MLTQYIAAAMRKAKYEILADDGTYYSEIPGFEGVYANTPSLEACREELAGVQLAGIFECTQVIGEKE